MESTKVIFRKFTSGDVIALFPELPGTNDWRGDCLSYQSVGQHGACCVAITRETRPAKPSEYADLARELRRIGYRLRIVQRFTRHDALRRRLWNLA